MPFVSHRVLSNRGNFHVQLLRRFKDIAVLVEYFYCRTLYIENKCMTASAVTSVKPKVVVKIQSYIILLLLICEGQFLVLVPIFNLQ